VTGPERLAEEVRAALEQRLRPAGGTERGTVLGAGSDDLEAGRAYLATLADGGWAVPTWPVEHGGMGLEPRQAAEVARELGRFEQPDLYPYLVGLSLVGPTLIDHGTSEQHERWLDPIRTGREIWCQLFSEPDAGSDLAGLASRAVRDGDEWRITGSKVWASRAHYAEWGFLLTRTDPTVPKHRGVTAFALPMRQPGVEVRPLRQMNGDAHFNEVFMDGAVVDDGDRIGGVGEGWGVAITALSYERGALGATGAGGVGSVPRVTDLVRARGAGAVARDRAVSAHVNESAARLTMRRAADRAQAGQVGPEGSGAKLRFAQQLKDASSLALGVLGPEGMLAEGPMSESEEQRAQWQRVFLTAPSTSIRGGTDEIQRNIVGERVLGLPPEPRVDKEVPFDEVPRSGRTG